MTMMERTRSDEMMTDGKRLAMLFSQAQVSNLSVNLITTLVNGLRFHLIALGSIR